MYVNVQAIFGRMFSQQKKILALSQFTLFNFTILKWIKNAYIKLQKRRGVPAIIDGVLEYIPEIKKEIEDLILQKENMLSAIDRNKQLVIDNSSHTSSARNEGRPTISVHEIAKGELVLQICTKRDQQNHDLSNLLGNLEAEGITILDASTVGVPHDRVCFHLHIQVYANWIISLSICLFFSLGRSVHVQGLVSFTTTYIVSFSSLKLNSVAKEKFIRVLPCHHFGLTI